MSAVVDPPKPLTAEEFAAMPELGRFTELVRGEVIDVPPPKSAHGRVCLNVGFALESHLRQHSLGRIVTNDSGVITEREPDTVRGADVAYYSFDRVPRGPLPEGYWPVPDLVVEVMSPDDVFRDLMAKVDEYLAAGVLLVVVIDPDRQQAMLFRRGELGTLFGPADELVFPGVLPELRIPVGPLFQ